MFSEFELKRYEKLVGQSIEKRRPPPHIRAELDLGFRFQGQSIEVFEVRPDWRENSTRREHSLARATYVTAKGSWKVFWKRADLRWHTYEPKPQVKTIEEFLALLDEDKHGCFFG